MKNLLGVDGTKATDRSIGKAEHLRILALEWMERVDGPAGFYTSAKYNGKGFKGLYDEMKSRDSWRRVPFWTSDPALTFGPLAYAEDTGYTRTEYWYCGRTVKGGGAARVTSITVKGRDRRHFTVIYPAAKAQNIRVGQHVRVQVVFSSFELDSLDGVDAYLEVRNSVTGIERIPIQAQRGE